MTTTAIAVPEPDDKSLAPLVRLEKMVPREVDEGAVHYVQRLMEMLPPPTDDVVDKITEALLSSESAMAENEFWEEGTTATRDAVGHRYIFRSVHMLPSDFQDSKLKLYLICRVTDMSTGEEGLLNTGSVSIVTALVKAQLLGALPWEAEIVGPRRKTRSGNTPLHLRWIAKIVEPDLDPTPDSDEY